MGKNNDVLKKREMLRQKLIGAIGEKMILNGNKNAAEIAKELKVPESTVRSLIQMYYLDKKVTVNDDGSVLVES